MENQKKGKDLTIAYIGGGSMNFGWRFIAEMAQTPELSGVVRLYDTDKKLSMANEVIGNRLNEESDCNSNMIYLAMDSMEETLRGADFVLLSISTGTLTEELSDIGIPQKYSIYQPAGNNTGPGGIMRAIRTIPVYTEIAKLIEKFCPKAWVISLTEPMSACLKTLYTVFPAIKAFGSSNDIFTTQELFAEIIANYNDVDDISIQDITTNVVGINKFSWMTKVSYNGDDCTHLFNDFVEHYIKTGNVGRRRRRLVTSTHFVQCDLFLRYGIIPASNDRYLAENCPPWYLYNQKVANNWKIPYTTTNHIKKLVEDRINMCKLLVNNDETLQPRWSGTDVINKISALSGNKTLNTNIVTLNKGQIDNLPIGSIVETNATFSHNNILTMLSGSVPKQIKPLIERQIYNSENLVEAIMEGNIEMIFNVFLNDPMVNIDIGKATNLFREMLKSNVAHIPKLKKEISAL